jgi:transcriptional regulator with PAS, ATPase and Fis domain
MKPNMLSLRVDTRLLAQILSDESAVEAVERLGTVFSEARDIEELWEKVLAAVADDMPAERSAVVIGDKTVASRKTPLELNRDQAARAIREQCAIYSDSLSTICVPMRNGAIHVESNRARPFTLNHVHRLIVIAREAAKVAPWMRQIEALEGEKSNFEEFNFADDGKIIGESPRMREVFDLIYKVAPLDSTIMVLGESGTGKDLVARAIHANSPRRDGPFISVNCAAINDNLIETELFGHERGAFTGAHTSRKGKFENANGGTIFLDEIGEVPPSLQTKLFHVLQNREFEAVGGSETIQLDVRVIVATNQDLKQMTRDGRFRKELYFRLNVIEFTMPALRERREDIPLLCGHFRKKYRTKLRPVDKFSLEAMEILCNYDWPGNVRELQNVIERAVGLSGSDTIEITQLPADIREAVGDVVPRRGLDAAIFEFTRSYVQRILNQVDGDVAAAAEILDIERQSFYRLAKRLRIDLS